jgi:hypothetical protein
MRIWPKHIPRSGCFVGATEMAATCAELVLGVRLGGYRRTADAPARAAARVTARLARLRSGIP